MLRLFSLNIETDKHFARFVPFLKVFGPDVVTLQEVPEDSIEPLKRALSLPHSTFAALTTIEGKAGPLVMGEAIFSRWPIAKQRTITYAGGSDGRTYHDRTSSETMAQTSQFALVFAEVMTDRGEFRIATTHFPWSPLGHADDIQRQACTRLIGEACTLGDLVLTGDFNAPRGREIFARLAKAFKDNIPEYYSTSIDGALHRAGQLPYMVDGLFTTPGYRAHDVVLHSGLSDHHGVSATITRA